MMGCGGSGSKTIVPTNTGNTVSDVESVMSQLNVPGVSIVVINNFEIVETLAIGTINQDTQELVTEQTVFQAASISKTLAAAATIKWATDNQITLDTEVSSLLTSWQLPENGLTTNHKVTIEGILRHTAGINVSGFPGYNTSMAIPTLKQVLAGSATVNTDAIEVSIEPNNKWLYSGGGYSVLQQAIEDQTGMTFGDFMQWQIVGFLGMDNSTFEQTGNTENFIRSSGHRQGNSPISGQYHIYPEQAAAGYWTNANDLAQFGIQLQLALKDQSQILTSEQVHKMLTTTLSSKYGIGLELFEDGYFGHSGSNAGFRSLMRLNPSGFGLIILTNSDKGEQLMAPIIKLFTDKYEQ